MPNRVPLQSVVVDRDGKRIVPPIGSVFEFTDAEIEQIEKVNPEALSDRAVVSADTVEAPAVKKAGKAGKKTGESDDL